MMLAMEWDEGSNILVNTPGDLLLVLQGFADLPEGRAQVGGRLSSVSWVAMQGLGFDLHSWFMLVKTFAL
jgi:hypothetical protein